MAWSDCLPCASLRPARSGLVGWQPVPPNRLEDDTKQHSGEQKYVESSVLNDAACDMHAAVSFSKDAVESAANRLNKVPLVAQATVQATLHALLAYVWQCGRRICFAKGLELPVYHQDGP